MKVKYLFMTVVAAFAMASCSNDSTGDNPNPVIGDPEGDSYTSLAIQLPSDMATGIVGKATDDGTTSENAVSTLHVYLFDQAAPHKATIATYKLSDLTQIGTSNVWQTKTAIKTTKADKYLYVGINVPSDVETIIRQNGYSAFSSREFDAAIATLAKANEFVMFSTAVKNVDAATELFETETQALANRSAVSVERVVAKVSVAKSSNFSTTTEDLSGTVSDLKFGWRNLNDKYYLVKKLQGSNIVDPNWASPNATQNAGFAAGADYFDVQNANDFSVFSYAPENTFNYVSGTSIMNDATYVSIKAVFTPAKVTRAKSNGTYVNYNSFEVVDNSTKGTFYLVKASDGSVYYFLDKGDAEGFIDLAKNNADGMPALLAGYDIDNSTYVDGVAYYHALVNKNETGTVKYDVPRNTYFKMTLTKVNGLGEPGDDFDDGKILEEDVNIAVEVTIEPWTLVEEEMEL